jgi:hypothetical protein
VISRVRITTGNVALAAGATDQNGANRDAVEIDDFIYAEPIPKPGTTALLASGALVGAARVRRALRSRAA